MLNDSPELNYEVDGNKLYIRLYGEIDHHSVQRLRKDADKLIYSERPRELVLDLGDVRFMDSSGLGFILGRYNLMMEYSGRISIINPNRSVMRVLELAGIKRIIPILQTEENKESEGSPAVR